MRVLLLFAVLALGGCGAQLGPAGEPSISNYNPISGNRGGSGSSS